MKYHAVLFFSLTTLLSISSSCYGRENPGVAEAATKGIDVQKTSASEATGVSSNDQQPGNVVTANVSPKLQKPSEAEAIKAAITYLNRDGQMTIQKSEFIAWGTFSEQRAYWPMKLRLTYKTTGSDSPRQNEYAVKISRDINGKLQASTYYAWRTDFK
jgi:hypothetical protein